VLRGPDSSLVMSDRSGLLLRTSPATPGSGLAAYGGASLLLASPAASPRPGTASGSSGSPGASTRIYTGAPSAAHHRAAAHASPRAAALAASEGAGRPGSAPAAVVRVGRGALPNGAHSSAANG
jgi:hypothetical protein